MDQNYGHAIDKKIIKDTLDKKKGLLNNSLPKC